jgi:hypothetical protein
MLANVTRKELFTIVNVYNYRQGRTTRFYQVPNKCVNLGFSLQRILASGSSSNVLKDTNDSEGLAANIHHF